MSVARVTRIFLSKPNRGRLPSRPLKFLPFPTSEPPTSPSSASNFWCNQVLHEAIIFFSKDSEERREVGEVLVSVLDTVHIEQGCLAPPSSSSPQPQLLHHSSKRSRGRRRRRGLRRHQATSHLPLSFLETSSSLNTLALLLPPPTHPPPALPTIPAPSFNSVTPLTRRGRAL